MASQRRSSVALLLLLMMTASAHGRSTQLVAPRRLQQTQTSCTSNKAASALAVSIVFAVCDGQVTMAAQSMAVASASGCGDTYAASIGVSVASISANNPSLTVVAAQCFSGALTLAIAANSGVAEAGAIAMAIVASVPYDNVQIDLISALASALGVVQANGASCTVVMRLANSIICFLNTNNPKLLARFLAYSPTVVPKCSTQLKQAAIQITAKCAIYSWATNWVKLIPQGVSLGCMQPYFTPDVNSLISSTSLAVSIAQVSCPSNSGNATVVAIAIAVAAANDLAVASGAIAGVLVAGVDITPVVLAVFTQTTGDQNKVAIQALGVAITEVAAADPTELYNSIALAISQAVDVLGCSTVQQQMLILGTAMNDPVGFQQMAALVTLCPALPLPSPQPV